MSAAASHAFITLGRRRRSTAASDRDRAALARASRSCSYTNISSASQLCIDSVPYVSGSVPGPPLDEAPAVTLEVERLVCAVVRAMSVQRTRDLCTCGERALIVRIDVVDVYADVVARGTGRLGAERAVGTLRADPDHAVAELDHRVADNAAQSRANGIGGTTRFTCRTR
jgi:hypothetical protein